MKLPICLLYWKCIAAKGLSILATLDGMEHIVDLHVHSHYSRATSRQCTLQGLYRWGKLKGVNIIGTGDFTHSAWLHELVEQLVPAEGGLFRLKDSLARKLDVSLPQSVRHNTIRFVPTTEIATSYSKGGAVRRIHQLIIVPDFTSVHGLNARLERMGNLSADGRPLIGMDSKELLRLVMETDPRALYIPAHIWTPWFGMFGSKSGFDSIEEIYEELSPQIRAVETGLSSDPAMNWRIAALRKRAVVSHSDAHSPEKLGREATVVKGELSYDDIIGAYRTNDQRLVGTIEFFPEEGKYHFDGHRACGVRFSPAETKTHGGICPQCSKPLVVGVDHRVGELADIVADCAPILKQVEYIVPLAEIIAELAGVKGTSSKKVTERYHQVIDRLGNEFSVLRSVAADSIVAAGFSLLAEAIVHLRAGDVIRESGYDGLFGRIKVSK